LIAREPSLVAAFMSVVRPCFGASVALWCRWNTVAISTPRLADGDSVSMNAAIIVLAGRGMLTCASRTFFTF
jgi:hypothetical protein